MNSPRSSTTLATILATQPTLSAEWRPFSVQVVDASPTQATVAFADHALGVYLSGRHRIHRTIEGRTTHGWSDPGTINFTPAGIEGTWEADGASRAVVLFMQRDFFSRVIAEHWEADTRNVETIKQFLIRDPVIESVVLSLAAESKRGSPSGQLYLESASEFLAVHIIHKYSTLSVLQDRPRGGLAARRLRAVLDYIGGNVGNSISLRDLAKVAGVSARHFERAFRQSVGIPAHAYVLERRLQTARDLLVGPHNASINEIALRAGFSNASHLAAAFRRQFGCTPTAFRRLRS